MMTLSAAPVGTPSRQAQWRANHAQCCHAERHRGQVPLPTRALLRGL